MSNDIKWLEVTSLLQLNGKDAKFEIAEVKLPNTVKGADGKFIKNHVIVSKGGTHRHLTKTCEKILSFRFKKPVQDWVGETVSFTLRKGPSFAQKMEPLVKVKIISDDEIFNEKIRKNYGTPFDFKKEVVNGG